MAIVKIGILAHVDVGKTSLTERILLKAGVIDAIGSIDDASTQTDSLALDRQGDITIKSAVKSFIIDDVTINLIDTPGHPEFIAEVERVLSVLDGAVLVISTVEGAQPQTHLLMRALQRLRLPTLISLVRRLLVAQFPQWPGLPLAPVRSAGTAYRWLDGESPTVERLADPGLLARNLAELIAALRRIDPTDGPPSGLPLAMQDATVPTPIDALGSMVDTDTDVS